MEYLVNKLNPDYCFAVEGVSYIGNPRENTAMYVTKKVAHLVENLESFKNCLVFAEEGVEVTDKWKKHNCFIFCSNPKMSYARFVSGLAEEKRKIDSRRRYKLTDGGYYIGENAEVGCNAYIEPGCVIGHDVRIGDNAVIMSGAVIKKSFIGRNAVVNEKAVVGAFGFTMAEDGQGNKLRIPTLGHVRIGDEVEVGAHDNISCGSGGDTVICDYVKLDAFVHIGHDARLGENVEITAGSIIGGFADIGAHAYVGLNSNVRNRISVGSRSIIGMGSNVTRSVGEGETVVGNPARRYIKDTWGGVS